MSIFDKWAHMYADTRRNGRAHRHTRAWHMHRMIVFESTCLYARICMYICARVCTCMCMYIRVSMYVWMYVCMYACMYACMICMYVCMNEWMNECMHVCMIFMYDLYVCMHVCMCVCLRMHVCMYARIHVRTHVCGIYIDTYVTKHTNIYTCTLWKHVLSPPAAVVRSSGRPLWAHPLLPVCVFDVIFWGRGAHH